MAAKEWVVTHVLEDGKVFGVRTEPEGGDYREVGGEGVKGARHETKRKPAGFWELGRYAEKDLGGEVESVLRLASAPSAGFMSPLTRTS